VTASCEFVVVVVRSKTKVMHKSFVFVFHKSRSRGFDRTLFSLSPTLLFPKKPERVFWPILHGSADFFSENPFTSVILFHSFVAYILRNHVICSCFHLQCSPSVSRLKPHSVHIEAAFPKGLLRLHPFPPETRRYKTTAWLSTSTGQFHSHPCGIYRPKAGDGCCFAVCSGHPAFLQ